MLETSLSNENRGGDGPAKATIDQWNEQQISGTIISGDASSIDVFISGVKVSSLKSSVDLIQIEKDHFSINTQYFPAACLDHVHVSIGHDDGTETTLRNSDAQQSSNVFSHSLYGGMWIDYPDWEERLTEKLVTGEVSEYIAALIRTFVADGYVVIPQAVSKEVISELNSRIAGVWKGEVPNHKIEIYGGPLPVVNVESHHYHEPHKLLDSYAHIPAAQHAASAPKVVEFMSAVFEDKPKAFQQLTFERGSQQAIHKDTAYVKIDGNPMSMMATWVALEDISEGTGELEYYVGSHRSPDFIFGYLSKWMEAAPGEHDGFLAALHADANTYGYVRSSFLPKAGDVLIWHADLAHGGSPVTKPGLTRRSLVTHFTAAKNAPYYSRWSKFSGNERNGVEFVSSYSNVTTD